MLQMSIADRCITCTWCISSPLGVHELNDALYSILQYDTLRCWILLDACSCRRCWQCMGIGALTREHNPFGEVSGYNCRKTLISSFSHKYCMKHP